MSGTLHVITSSSNLARNDSPGSPRSPKSPISPRSPGGHHRALNRSDSDLTHRPSLAKYELRPHAGTSTGQVVAKRPAQQTEKTIPEGQVAGESQRKSSEPPRKNARPSASEQILVIVEADVQTAAKLLKSGNPREAVAHLQRAYRKVDITSGSTSEAPVMKLARAMVRLQLAHVYFSLSRHREAVEEAVSAMLEADTAWQAMISATMSPSTVVQETSRPPLAEAVLRTLLENPPPWLERTAEISILTRCCAAGALRAAAASADVQISDATNLASKASEAEAIQEANNFIREADMLGKHFLPKGHPARQATEAARQPPLASVKDEGADSEMARLRLAFDTGSPLSGRTEEELTSWKAARDSQLPPLSGLQARRRLPPSREATTTPLATAQSSVTFQDQESSVPSLEESFAPTCASSAFRATAPVSSWTGRCPPGDVYVSTLPKSKLPQLSSGKKLRKGASQAKSGEGHRAEGSVGMSFSAPSLMAPQEQTANAFQDWLSSFDDPARNDIKRIIMRSDEASKRFAGQLKNQAYHFKYKTLEEMSHDELYELRIRYSGYGIRAAKITDKRKAHTMTTPSDDALAKRQTRSDLFKFYRVDPGRGEPSLRTLGKLLKESEPGRDRNPKKSLTHSHQQVAKDMQAMFSGGLHIHKPALESPPESPTLHPDTHELLETHVGAAFSETLDKHALRRNR